MKFLPVLWDNVSCLGNLINAEGFEEGRRILEGKTEYLAAQVEDTKKALFSASFQHGKKRKRDDTIFCWVTKGQELVKDARSALGNGVETYPQKKSKVRIWSISCAKKLVEFHKLNKALSAHEKEFVVLPLSDGRGPDRGNFIPVRELFGRAASEALEQLQATLQGDEIGRIAIQGTEGTGKTFLMKHLHNSVLEWAEKFDYIFWVTSPPQFSIKRLQESVAAAVKCDLRSEDDVNKRAEILSGTLAGLGSFVIFLDDVPETQFSLIEIGIPVPAKGTESKLVLTTRSALVSEKLNCFGSVTLGRLPDEEACQLFLKEAGISSGSACLPILLARECQGVPRLIEDTATLMSGIDDPREWNHALFKFRNFKKGQHPISGNH